MLYYIAHSHTHKYVHSYINTINLICNVHTFSKDTHTPGGYRTHGVVMNSKEFAEDFKCSEKSPMNPEKKCEVWASPISKSKDIIKIELIPESEKKDEIIY